ncbi:hypothetical protein NC981_07785 [Leptolyngbya sp. DQ-M1]|uniref:hypothetical protein n=1 Tax=Leptolyngbya sp. DQ-M1 TaxID=2933920 RepID=UPI0032984CB2
MFLIVPGVVLMASFPAFAQSLPSLPIVDRQCLTRDLTPTNAQDFFKQGQAQFEREIYEIQLLERRSQVQQEDLLKIEPATRDFDKLTVRSRSLTRNLKR